jgi:hypothetical protein
MESEVAPDTLTPPTAREQVIQRRLEEFERSILSLARGNFDDVPEITGEDEMLDAIASGIATMPITIQSWYSANSVAWYARDIISVRPSRDGGPI